VNPTSPRECPIKRAEGQGPGVPNTKRKGISHDEGPERERGNRHGHPQHLSCKSENWGIRATLNTEELTWHEEMLHASICTLVSHIGENSHKTRALCAIRDIHPTQSGKVVFVRATTPRILVATALSHTVLLVHICT
jgi:hypothetical protein